MAEDVADRYAIAELINRYFAAVDDDRLDLSVAQATFTADARLIRPNGHVVVGPQEILASQQESFARFRALHHVITNHVIDVEKDQAQVRANVTAMHLWKPAEVDRHSLDSCFLAGGVLQVLGLRTSSGWRLTELANRVVWRTGAGFAAMLRTGPTGGAA
jgi:hypothetical protein